MRGEDYGEVMDDEVDKMLAMGNEVSLVIDGTEDGGFKGRFVVGQGGESFDVECPVGKTFVMTTGMHPVRTGPGNKL